MCRVLRCSSWLPGLGVGVHLAQLPQRPLAPQQPAAPPAPQLDGLQPRVRGLGLLRGLRVGLVLALLLLRVGSLRGVGDLLALVLSLLTLLLVRVKALVLLMLLDPLVDNINLGLLVLKQWELKPKRMMAGWR